MLFSLEQLDMNVLPKHLPTCESVTETLFLFLPSPVLAFTTVVLHSVQYVCFIIFITFPAGVTTQ